MTHSHPEAIAFAQLHASALATTNERPELLSSPASFCAAVLADLPATSLSVVRPKVDLALSLVAQSATRAEAAEALGTSPFAAESVSAAFWSFLTQHESFSAAVASAALLGGDVDSICCLVGALAGALHGASGIDDSWIANLAREMPSPEEILALADEVHALAPVAPEEAG